MCLREAPGRTGKRSTFGTLTLNILVVPDHFQFSRLAGNYHMVDFTQGGKRLLKIGAIFFYDNTYISLDTRNGGKKPSCIF